MTLTELLEKYERRRAEAALHGATAPLAKVYELVVEELRAVDHAPDSSRLVSTKEAARILSVSTKTVRRWLARDRFPRATKTADGGEWRVPLSDVYAVSGRKPKSTSVPRLWEPDA